MKIVRFLDEQGIPHYGCDPRDGTAELLDGDLLDGAGPSGKRVRITRLLAPVTPPNTFGIGLNYREHAIQMGLEIPDEPVMFMKPTTAITHPGDPVLIPKCAKGSEVDYECELSLVIGRTARDVPEDKALDYVFGYTVANEVTARQWAKHSRSRGKTFDGFCPVGPVLVTADEIPDPQNLNLTTRVNGKVMQQGNTGDMIFSVAQIISFISMDTTLLPGTLIMTGTPPGSGVSQTPPVFLSPGDEVEVEIEGIGTLSNPVTADHEGVHRAA